MTKLSSDDPDGSLHTVLAERAIKLCWPHLNLGTAEYSTALDGLKAMATEFGSHKFELYHNLRSPADRVEEWTRDCYQGRMTKSEFRERLKRWATSSSCKVATSNAVTSHFGPAKKVRFEHTRS